jgi:hypothetical protein
MAGRKVIGGDIANTVRSSVKLTDRMDYLRAKMREDDGNI